MTTPPRDTTEAEARFDPVADGQTWSGVRCELCGVVRMRGMESRDGVVRCQDSNICSQVDALVAGARSTYDDLIEAGWRPASDPALGERIAQAIEAERDLRDEDGEWVLRNRFRGGLNRAAAIARSFADTGAASACQASESVREACEDLSDELPHIACPCRRAPGSPTPNAAPSDEDALMALADFIHNAISPPGTDRCHEDGDGYAQCFHVAESLLASDLLRTVATAPSESSSDTARAAASVKEGSDG